VSSVQWLAPFDIRENQGLSSVYFETLWQDWPRKALSKFPFYERPGLTQFGPSGNYRGHGKMNLGLKFLIQMQKR
jgi:hypothetical protein